MAYASVLFVHSWLRWIVLLLGVAVLGRMLSAGAAPPRALRLHRAFIAAIDLQFILGLSLYLILSPTVRAAWTDVRVAMSQDALRFYFVEHAFGMIVAVGAAHLAWSRRRGGDTQDRVSLGAQIAWLVVTLLTIPWPFLPYGRPLFRLAFP